MVWSASAASASRSPRAAKNWERADADVGGGDTGQDGAGQGRFTVDILAGQRGGERAGRGDADGGHRLGTEVFAEHGAEPGAPIAAARPGGAAGALELDVAAQAIGADHFAEKDGAAVAQLGVPVAELVAGIGLASGCAPSGMRLPARIAAPSGVASAAGSRPSERASASFSATRRGARRGRREFGKEPRGERA